MWWRLIEGLLRIEYPVKSGKFNEPNNPLQCNVNKPPSALLVV